MKFWKNWPYWLKGGIIALILSPIIFVFDFFYRFDLPRWLEKTLGYFPTNIEPTLTSIFCKAGSGQDFFLCFNISMGIGIALVTIEFILIGSITGWLYGKVKNRRPNIINN